MTVSPSEADGVAGCCRIVQVKLNVSSSSLESRIRKAGGEPGRESGSCTYSTGVSSPLSRFAAYLVVGKALGVMFTRFRPREFVIVRPAIETVATCQKHRIVTQSWTATETTHIESGPSGIPPPHRVCCPRRPCWDLRRRRSKSAFVVICPIHTGPGIWKGRPRLMATKRGQDYRDLVKMRRPPLPLESASK